MNSELDDHRRGAPGFMGIGYLMIVLDGGNVSGTLPGSSKVSEEPRCANGTGWATVLGGRWSVPGACMNQRMYGWIHEFMDGKMCHHQSVIYT